MDIFGDSQYIARRTLALARENDLVKYAACAASTKHLGHISDPDVFARGLSFDEAFPKISNKGGTDFLWYGAKFYGRAVQSMAAQLAQESGMSVGSPQHSTPGALVASADGHMQLSSLEARLLAVSIMCQYEELSASWRAWTQHLNALYRLLWFDLRENMIRSASERSLGKSTDLSRECLLPLFWRFVQNDFEESLISCRRTRLGTQEREPWQSMGLPVGEHGIVNPSQLHVQSGFAGIIALRGMLRLMCQIVNFRASCSETNASPREARFCADDPGEVSWADLDQELSDWKEAFPSCFTADLVQRRHGTNDATASEFMRWEAWFASDTCAMATAYFHMAKMMLLVQRPHDTHVRTDWLNSYRSLHKNLASHAGSVMAIALGSSRTAVRTHLLQPLYVTGRCLTQEPDQFAVVRMLRTMEKELGIATGYRVNALLQEWDIDFPHESAELDSDLTDLSSAG